MHDSHIVYLKNEAATREAIIGYIKSHLIKNDRIGYNDPILIYYAGHGGRVLAPTGWYSDDDHIETICPHDERMPVNSEDPRGGIICGIPDITFRALINELAKNKGNNIVRHPFLFIRVLIVTGIIRVQTVIFDSCHSGGIARDPAPDNVRAIRNPALILNKIDSNILASTSHPPKGGFRTSISSYVLLAACQQEEYAHEDGGDPCHGRFTASLHKALTECHGQRITCAKLMERVVSSCSGQRPQYEGAFNRFLFTLNQENVIGYELGISEDGKQTIDVGRIHGVTVGTEFAVKTEGEPSVALLADTVGATSSTLVTSPEKEHPSFPKGTIAALSKFSSDDAVLIVFVDSTSHPKLAEGLEQLTNTVYPSPTRFLLRGQRPAADIEITQDSNGEFIIERLDSLTYEYSKPIFQSKIKDDLDALSSKLSAIAHFKYHLGRQHVGQMLRDVSNPTSDDPMTGVTLEFHRLVEGECKVDSRSLLVNNVACQTYDKDAQYAIGIRNHSRKALFPYVFAFDPSDYEIQVSCFNYH